MTSQVSAAPPVGLLLLDGTTDTKKVTREAHHRVVKPHRLDEIKEALAGVRGARP